MSCLEPQDLFSLKFLRNAHLSPDGQRIAYAISLTDVAEERFEIWIADAISGETQRLAYAGNAVAPRWSPDGLRLAFVGDGRLRLASIPPSEVCETLTPPGFSVEGSPSWSPDGRRLAVSLRQHQRLQKARQITSYYFRADGIGYFDYFRQEIYDVDCTTGVLRRLTAIERVCANPQWSPCGRRILFFVTNDPGPVACYSPRLCTIDVEDGKFAEILGNEWYVMAARWLPGGERIVIAAARNSTLTIPTLSIWTIARNGDDPQCRTGGATGNVGFRIHHDMPAWEFTYGNMLTVLDSATAFASVQNGGSVEIWRITLEGDAAVDRVLVGERSCIVLDANAARSVLLYAVTDLHSPLELRLLSLHSYGEFQLTKLNNEILSQWPRVRVERFTFKSSDGTDVEAWFMATCNRELPLPTVLFIHGGPFIATGNAFRYDFLLLAAQGFGILFANFRGSAGYGEPFVRAILGDWGERGYLDHIGTVDAAIERGFADPERLGVWGASHGGFATCWIVGHTQRFRAAIAEAAITNFSTLYYLTDTPDVFSRELGGRPHEIPDVYRARSPLTYAHRCTTPTLLVHGEDDLRCPIAEAEQFYRALLDVRCTTELLRIPDCDHLGDSSGPLAARRSQNEALLNWFQRYL